MLSSSIWDYLKKIMITQAYMDVIGKRKDMYMDSIEKRPTSYIQQHYPFSAFGQLETW